MTDWINEFKKSKIPFSWSELKIGRFGYSNKFYLPAIIDDDVVITYTLNYLSKHENENNQYLWDLGSLTAPYNESEIYKYLSLVSSSERKDLKAYFRWRWILVNNLIRELFDKDGIDALLEITEFWLKLESPVDKPYQYQGVNNELTLSEFYTDKNLHKVIYDHIKWLRKEKNNLL
ncbi:DUF2247 family protein [Xylocopilactobacillus apicola]|uniref:DUF2247 domain-containing protein n=1 Tax=Xylocopilactobacillus apicola TaxID=2932184 RepID=A0AAU9DH65_9LACO|nr:DUF2247 family protein [Xylocopilactobacillus apicola]BDR59325.1 hypothetical protein XA3_17660 [Xylocopilactobacillus apicola]